LDLPFAAAVARGRPTAVVYHLCLPPPATLPRWLRTALSRVDVTLSVSAHTLELWRDTGLPLDRAQVVLTSVDLDTYMPAPSAVRAATRKEFGIDAEARVVFYGGRLTPEKGVDVLVRAFRQVAEKVEASHLVVLGSPGPATDHSEAERFVEELRALADGLPVTFIAQRADVVPLLAAADVATLPSVWPEPLSRSIMEALACGVPVVATAVGGSPEILSGSLAKLLVEPGDPAALAQRLLSVLEWRVDDPEEGPRCRQAAEDRLSVAEEVDLIERAMFDAVTAKRA
jgi:glycosyltransferase involved in cell wall biosynthesis